MKTLYLDAFSSSDCVVLTEMIMIGKDVKWKDHGLIWANIQGFPWWGWGKPQKSSVKIAKTQAMIEIVTSWKWCYQLDFDIL
jgi:hypothetical protein